MCNRILYINALCKDITIITWEEKRGENKETK